ncbi:MAG: hypothetical protein ACI4B3_03920 [Prevotella sp.]
MKVLKHRLKKEGNESVTNCNQLKLTAENGKLRFTDVADTGQFIRIIQREQLEAKTGRNVVSPLSAKRLFEAQISKGEIEGGEKREE